MSQPASIEIKRYQCRHVFTDGHRCGSPCLKQEEFCYYHHTTRRPARDTGGYGPEQAEFDISIPEDRSAIQSTIGEVLRRIARNEIDPKRAGLLLYGLQIASLNIARAAEPVRDAAPVEEITADPELGTLAPRAEVAKPKERSSFAATLIEEFKRQQAERAAASQAANPPKPPAEPAILPIIQACHSNRREYPARSLRTSNPSGKSKTPPCRRPSQIINTGVTWRAGASTTTPPLRILNEQRSYSAGSFRRLKQPR
jgi:hypothetical protein